MRKFTLNIFTLSLGLAVMPMVEAAPTAQQQLLEQVRLGEATHREDLVQQSLYRLELIDPNNPDVVAARFRSLLRQGDYVLTLFGQGWDQHRFRFSTKGELLPDWGQECANSH